MGKPVTTVGKALARQQQRMLNEKAATQQKHDRDLAALDKRLNKQGGLPKE